MAFLRKKGSFGRFTFDVIYSCLQKSLRRNDVNLAIEMGMEFRDYPNALKKRLIQNMTEDCPNFYIITEIYKTDKTNFDTLLGFIPVICNHMKCREAQNGFRYACEQSHNHDALDIRDNMLTMLCKIRTLISENKCSEILNFFQNIYQFKTKLSVMCNFISKNRTFYLGLVSFHFNKYLHVKSFIVKPILNFTGTTNLKLPDYVFDKHVSRSNRPKEGAEYRSSYRFFMDNLVLEPRMPETELERLGRELYIETNEGTSRFL